MADSSGRLAGTRCRLSARVVAAFGAHDEFAVALGLGFDANLTELSSLFGVCRFVTDRVLVADVIGDCPADGIHFIESLREKSDAAGTLGEHLQSFFRVLGMLFITQNPDRIHGWPALFLQLFH